MLFLHHLHHEPVDVRTGLLGAGKRGISAQIFVGAGLQRHHAELFGHAILSDHGPGQFRGFLDVIGSTCGDGAEDQFFRGAAAGKGGDLVFQFCAVHEVMVVFFHLHGVAQGTGGAGNDGDLRNRGGMALKSSHKGMTHFMIGHDLPLLIGEDLILFLVSGDDDFDAFLQIRLVHRAASHPDGTKRGFIDKVRQIGAGAAGRSPGNGGKVYVIGQTDLFGMNSKDRLTACHIRQFHRNAAVKTAGTQKGGIQDLRPVGGGQDDNAFGTVKSVHFRQQLVESLFPFIIAADGTAAFSLLANGIDLVDKYDAGSFLVGLLEQVTYFGSTHAYEHLHEFRTGNGEEGDIRLTGHGFGQQSLAGARRADQQCTLRHLGADILVFGRIMEEIHDLLKGFLCFLFTGHIGKLDAGLRRNIDFGVGRAETHGIGQPGSATLEHPLKEELSDQDKKDHGEEELRQKSGQPRLLGNDLASKGSTGCLQPVDELRIVHASGLVVLSILRSIGKQDLIRLDLHFLDLLVVHHLKELTVIHFLDLRAHEKGKHGGVEDQNDKQRDAVVQDQRFSVAVIRLLFHMHSHLRTGRAAPSFL